jgi:hypothetical protein
VTSEALLEARELLQELVRLMPEPIRLAVLAYDDEHPRADIWRRPAERLARALAAR